MGRVREDPSGGILQAPAVRLRWTAEVTPTGVVICVTFYPRHLRRFWPGGGGAAEEFLVGPFPGPWEGGTRERLHPPTGEIGGTGPTETDKDGP